MTFTRRAFFMMSLAAAAASAFGAESKLEGRPTVGVAERGGEGKLEARPTVAALAPGKLAEIDAAVIRRIEEGQIPGAVVWIERLGEAHRRAFGWKTLVPDVSPMGEDTIFDVASLTKVVATTTAVMKLVEEGRLDLDAPVKQYIPEFSDDGRDAIPVRWLMTHNSGLPPGIKFDEAAPWSGYGEGISRACRESLTCAPGTDFVYSDINFILLGEIVRRVSGGSLADFCAAKIFEPLDMSDTGFLPPVWKRSRIAPTTVENDRPVRGIVHDPTSRRMGGVTGHAGLFSTSRDLARFCRMLLNRGSLDGVRVLSEDTVSLMTRVQSPETVSSKRGLGWDIESRFTRQRGDYFSEGSFGHTGWTGPSLWIDPASQTLVVFLTNRNHPAERGSTGTLRHRIGTLAAEAAAGWGTVALPGFAIPLPRTHEWHLPVVAPESGRVLNGIDVLEREQFRLLQGLRVGLITNHTGINRDGRSTIDVLGGAPGVQLTALFSPEHGIRGALDQARIADSKDQKTGLPVFSLYGKTRAPTAEQLAKLDALIFDIQDIGCRFYTYVSTMVLAMEAASKAGKRFIVLDRVNPINGAVVGGPLREGPDSFTAAHRIPLRHGMTVGELARLIASERKWKLRLDVVKCVGWRRDRFFDQTGLPWINPSPNMRSLTAAVLYPGVGILEFTNISVGRGTDAPFEFVGAPWMDGAALAKSVNESGLPGVRAVPVEFMPVASVHKGEVCRGVRLILTDRAACEPAAVGAVLATALCRRHPDKYQTQNLNKLLCHSATVAAIKAGKPGAEIRDLWRADERAFILRRRKWLLY